MNEWMKENEWKKWMKEWVKEWINERMNERMNGRINERINEKKRWGCLNGRFELSKILKGKQEKNGCYRVVDLNLCRKVVYLNNKRFTRRKTEKKMVLAELWIWNQIRKWERNGGWTK